MVVLLCFALRFTYFCSDKLKVCFSVKRLDSVHLRLWRMTKIIITTTTTVIFVGIRGFQETQEVNEE